MEIKNTKTDRFEKSTFSVVSVFGFIFSTSAAL